MDATAPQSLSQSQILPISRKNVDGDTPMESAGVRLNQNVTGAQLARTGILPGRPRRT